MINIWEDSTAELWLLILAEESGTGRESTKNVFLLCYCDGGRKNEKKRNQLSLVCHSLNAESGGFLNEILQLVASKLILVCLFVTSWEEQTRGGETDENIGESITDFTSLNTLMYTTYITGDKVSKSPVVLSYWTKCRPGPGSGPDNVNSNTHMILV